MLLLLVSTPANTTNANGARPVARKQMEHITNSVDRQTVTLRVHVKRHEHTGGLSASWTENAQAQALELASHDINMHPARLLLGLAPCSAFA
jgi:hypothetical protein